MGQYGTIPDHDSIPYSTVHVGWRCTAADHDCLIPLTDAEPCGDGLVLGPNHHGGWVPVFAWKDDLGDNQDGDGDG